MASKDRDRLLDVIRLRRMARNRVVVMKEQSQV
jgi:hypothetical protein